MSWEDKAKLNASYAIQTTEDLVSISNRDLSNFSNNAVKDFWTKGTILYRDHIEKWTQQQMGNPDFSVLEFGCGVGRILRNFDQYSGNIIGVDVSRTQIRLAKKLSPSNIVYEKVKSNKSLTKYVNKIDFAFSFAVFKHIGALSEFEFNLRKLCQTVRKGGILLLNAHCFDLQFSPPGFTLNFENESWHFKRKSEVPKFHYSHKQDQNWSGVYVGLEYLKCVLYQEHFVIEDSYQHNPSLKPGNTWFICKKILP